MFMAEKDKFSGWFRLDERIRFVSVGFFNMGLRYILFVLLGLLWAIHYQIILMFSWLLSSVIAFFAYKTLVFRTEGNHLKEYLKCIATWSVSYGINVVILQILAGRFSWNIYVSQAIAIVVITVINYLLFKHFAFRSEPKPLTRWEKLTSFLNVFSR